MLTTAIMVGFLPIRVLTEETMAVDNSPVSEQGISYKKNGPVINNKES